jgi:hypothetical protein
MTCLHVRYAMDEAIDDRVTSVAALPPNRNDTLSLKIDP